MDSRLKERLDQIDEHIKKLFSVEHEYLTLEGNEKAMLASLTANATGKSHAEKQTAALASSDWRDFMRGLALKKAEYLRERRRYELLLKAYDGEHLTMKNEGPAIRRQV